MLEPVLLVKMNRLPATGALGLPRGAKVRIKLGEIDEITLDITSAVIERLDVVADVAGEEPDADEDDVAAGPIAIAVDVNESPEDATASS